MTTAELGRRLHVAQGLQWLYSHQGDPYADVLRGFGDPYPAYGRIRARGPLWRSRTGSWVTADHGVATRLLRDGGSVDGARLTAVQQVMPPADAVAHAGRAETDRLRRLGPRAMDRYRELVDRVAATVLDDTGGRFDVAVVTWRIAVGVLAGYRGLAGTAGPPPAAACAAAGLAADAAFCPQRLADVERMRAAVDDLARLVAGDPLQLLLAVVGVRTAADLAGEAVAAALAHPGEWRRLAADSGRARPVVAETLRYAPPVHLHPVAAPADLDVAGARLPAGAHVVVIVGAANRDPAAFTPPDRFDPDRTGDGVLLAGGYHGAVLPFARAHAETVLAALAARFPTLRACGPALRRPRAPVTRGLLRLPVQAA